HEKEYIVTGDRPVIPSFVQGMSSGVKILGQRTLPCEVTRVSEYVFRIILTEGKNRQIRRMCAAFGYQVKKLQRLRIMNIRLGSLQKGAWRDLTEAEKLELGQMLEYTLS
ncbi:23S rRNA pseudouridine synthase F, partial [Bacillus cereus]|nr:23S rRNA pseudouridine synthase F [Bacillus cereus]